MRGWTALILLASCSPEQATEAPVDGTETSRALDEAAIASGQLADPALASADGAYDDGTAGGDRVCVADGRIGLVIAGGGSGVCVARGSAERDGDDLRLELGSRCGLDARLQNGALMMPARVPDGCRALCRGRASLAGATVPKRSDERAAALALTDLDGRPLCPDAGKPPA